MDKETVWRARQDAHRAFKLYERAKALYERLEKDYRRKAARFRSFDYELMQTDGRLKVIPEHTRKAAKETVLTLQQIMDIAKVLGVKLGEDEDEDKREETKAVD